jgi:hypothetical protein
MNRYYAYDSNGFFTGDVFADDQSENMTTVQPPQNPSLFHAKWAESEWIEGATQEYIESMKVPNQPSNIDILQQQNAQLLLQSAQQEQMINDLQTQNAAIMLQMAQMGGAS